jgi:hypothetical protein
MSATRAIQTAIYAVLSADATLTGLATGGVHNDIPDGQSYPHVLISRATETPWHTFGGASSGLGWKNIIRIHVYSRYQGDTEAMRIHERIVSLLNFQPLTVSGYTVSICEYEQMRLLVEDVDKIETRHLVGEFCVRVRQ